MNSLLLGTLCGILFGLLSVGLMIPLKFEDKRTAMLGAFINRFSIGFVPGALHLPIPYWLAGLLIGVLLSLSDAIITRSYVPLIVIGALGGLLIGVVIDVWGV